jgi:hypothetical protein
MIAASILGPRERSSGMRHLLLCLALLSAACGDATAPEADAGHPIRTDRLSYEAVPFETAFGHTRYEFTVVATFRNTTTDTVYLNRCTSAYTTPIFGVYAVGMPDDWGSAYDPGYACGGPPEPFTVLPGQERTDTLHLRGFNIILRGGIPQGEMDGRKFIRYFARSCDADGCRQWQPRSNDFVVTLRRGGS